jgi:hypothetical protein
MRPSIWKRLSSSNWWWYGEVNPDPATLPPPEQRPRFWQFHMKLFVALWLWGLGAPLVSSYLNYEIPAEAQLQTLRGQVIVVNNKSPHMQIKLENGAVVNAEFPVRVMYWGGISETRFFDYPAQEKVLTCKDVQVSGVYLRYVPFERLRVWDLQCKNNSYIAGFPAIRSERMTQINSGDFDFKFAIAIAIGTLILFLFANFIRERKDHGRKN